MITSDESRIQQLLEEALESGRAPEEVCGDFPELLWRVRERLRERRAIVAEIDALFSSSSEGMARRRRRLLSPDDPLPQIPGYTVEAVLGRGGVGVVYRARHVKLNRYVAPKMLSSGAYADPHELARFTREAQAVASLRHCNIVQVYDVEEFDGRPFFTMELLDGGSLAQKLAGTPQPVAQAASLVATLAAAANVAHVGGIVHRDLKPSNVLLAADGTPKISDFGLARRMAKDETMTGIAAHVGTPSYMAPEQAIGKLASAIRSVLPLLAVEFLEVADARKSTAASWHAGSTISRAGPSRPGGVPGADPRIRAHGEKFEPTDGEAIGPTV